MPSPPILDFNALLAPIPGDNPAGAPLPYDVRLKFEELRKEVNPDDYDADDPRRPAQYQKPDWAGIVQLATKTIVEKSKDLLAAARLVEALVMEKGFPGLRDGLELLNRLTSECWDRIYPILEDGETPEAREGPFKWLNQATFGAKFPVALRLAPLLTVDGKSYNLTDWQSQDRRGAFESAIDAAPAQACQDVVDDLKSARQKLQALSDSLHEKMGEFAPDLVSSENTENLGAAVNDCIKIANLVLQRKTGAGSATNEGQPMSSPNPGESSTSVARSLASRADAYRMLNDAAEMLQRIEPHSPVPLLVKRAVKLGDLKFPDLMRALIRENATLDELDRLMGISPPPTPPG
jgi:type VI secretion system protein ImpA